MSMQNVQNRISFERHSGLVSLVAGAVFFLAGLWLIGFHETWRDEYQAWLIADTADNLNILFQNHRYEGQPVLWHMLLWGISSLGLNFGAVKVFHLLLSAASVSLIFRFSPFPLGTKTLLATGYYLLFEFSLIVRPYGLTFLLLIVFCIFYCAENRRFIWLAVCIALVANTQTYGLVLAGWLTFLFGLTWYTDHDKAPFGEKLTSGFIILAGFFIALVFIYPEADNGFINRSRPTLEAWKILEVLDGFFRSIFPVPKLDTIRFWNSNVVDPLPRVVVGFSGAMLLAGWVFIFRKDKKVLIAFLTGTGLFLLTNYMLLHYPFSRNYRHSGHFFLVLLACYWMFKHSKRGEAEPKRRIGYGNWAFLMILVIQTFASLLVLQREIRYPFSNSRATGAFLSNSEFAGLPILNIGDAELTSIAGVTDKPVYYLNRNAYGSFAIWKKFDEIDDSAITGLIVGFLNNNNLKECLYIATSPMESRNLSQYGAGLKTDRVGTFDQPNATKEDYFIYRIQK